MRKRLCFILFALSVVLGVTAQNDTVVFSAGGGFYEEVLALELFNSNPQNHIRYTTNGNRPTAQSPLYEGPLVLDTNKYSRSEIYTIVDCPVQDFYLPDSVQHCIVIRAAVFDENDSCVSTVKTNSYFIHALGCDTHGLPAVSLCADSLALFDYETGIFVPGIHQVLWNPGNTGNYYQKGREWERLCNVEFYESDNSGINQQAGLRTHGGATRRLQQKNLKIYAREEYGKKRFKHKFFQEIPIESFKHLVLKPFCCSYNLATTSGIQDALSQQVARGLHFDVLANRLTTLFINGEYWGIYGIEETPDERYIEDHYDFDPDEINIIKDWKVLDNGDSTNWMNLYSWVHESDLSLEENYALMEERIDMDNFIDYWVYEIYSCNFDWPIHNTRCWQRGDGKWRWIFYDGDACFLWHVDPFENVVDTTAKNANAESTLFFRKLIENPVFLERFKGRFIELMSDQLQYSYIAPYFNMLRETIRDEIPNQCQRFGFPSDVDQWERDMTHVYYFLRSLDERMLTELLEFYEQHYDGTEERFGSFQCYPNPFSGVIHLCLDSEAMNADEISIFDLTGRKVFSLPVHAASDNTVITIDPNLTTGVYILKIGGRALKIIRQ